MRRLMSLENSFYHRKYKEIYKLLFLADLDEISDHSNWYKTNLGYVEKNRPLWIIVESKIINKRIWITQDFGSLGISTAELDLDVKTSAYSSSFIHIPFKNQKEMIGYLEKLLEPCLKEYREEEKFEKNVNIYKQEIKEAKERIVDFCGEGKKISSSKYITLEDIGRQYSKEIANIMFDLGYAKWDFKCSDTLEEMKKQMIDILEGDANLNEILEKKGLTKEQLYRQIKADFLECELSNYLQDYCINIEMIPEDIKKDMINQVREGMINNYSYKYIIWDSGDLDKFVEVLPEECFDRNNIDEEEQNL